jgi:hypothetical protein
MLDMYQDAGTETLAIAHLGEVSDVDTTAAKDEAA